MTGRWWALLLVPPAVILVLALGESVLPQQLRWWLAIVEGAFGSLGVVGGVLIRRLADRFAS